MRRYRLLILLLGLLLALGLILWLVNTLQWFYLRVAYTSPFLANLLLFLFLILLLALMGACVYYFWPFRGKKHPKRTRPRQQPPPKVPKQKKDAAIATLEAVEQQVAQIQDQVARQALQERSRTIAAQLSRSELKVVVFGTGSAGKTSLVNALVGRLVGQVGVTMGTTAEGATYRVQLQDTPQSLLVTDTPGLLEVGVAGTQREQAARKLATETDLLLFVVEGDLTQSEYQPLRALGQMGKRSLLVFNKTDLYPTSDVEAILRQLRDRVQGWIAPADVVAIAAAPQARRLTSGQVVAPDPLLLPLIQRVVTIVRQEGDDLLADNILLQSQRLGEEARTLIDQQRRSQADRTVERFQWIGAGVIWVTPLPVIDLLATAAVNAQMVVDIATVYRCELTLEEGKELAVSLAKTLGGLGIVKGAIQLFSHALQVTVVGYVVGKTIQSISAAYLTRIAGKSFIEYFRNGQEWGDGGMAEVVQRHFQLNRRDGFVKAFIQDAITQLPSEFAKIVQKRLGPVPELDIISAELEQER